MNNIFLIGIMGAGKSTVGALLAPRMNYTFVDLDALIENEVGQPISEIFEGKGESYFRDLESTFLAKLCLQEKQVIALGGGTLVREGNREWISGKGVKVYLQASISSLVRRLQGDRVSNRPLLRQAKDLSQTLEDLFRAREPLYLSADFCIRTDVLTPEDVAGEVLKVLRA